MATYKRTKKLNRKKKRSTLLPLSILFLCLVIGTILYLRFAPSSKHKTSVGTANDEPLSLTTAQESKPVVQKALPAHDVTIPPVTNGLAPLVSHLNTDRPVVFLGIDDGANKQDFELQMMKDNNIRASLFLANRFMNGNADFFKPFVPAGSLIEDHTLNHKLLSKLSYEEQVQEICGQANLEEQEYGRRPILFRPPGGDYNVDTQRATAACGMKAVVLWVAKANGGSMQYQVGHSLRPGDVVLMHFRPEFKSDMQAFLNAEQAAGLHTELLEDWLQPSGPAKHKYYII